MPQRQLTDFARIALLNGLSPVAPLDRLSRHLGGPRIWIKRDDVGPLIGGNKLRKLEFLLADALARQSDCIIAMGAIQSNHARLTAAASIVAGLTCHIVLEDKVGWPGPAYASSGNRLLETLMGTSVTITAPGEDMADVAERKRKELTARGQRPYVVPFGGSCALANLGYVDCAGEIGKQQVELDVTFSHAFVGSGSAGTQAGLVVGKLLEGLPGEIVGVNVLRAREDQEILVREQAYATAELLGLSVGGIDDAVLCDDGHYLPGYGWPNDGVREAIELCARLEGIILDPVYTGKAMAGLIQWIRDGRLGADDTPLFIHTGGLPGIFAYEQYFTAGAEAPGPA